MSDLVNAEQIAEQFKRKPAAIEVALRKLGMEGAWFRMGTAEFRVWHKPEAFAALTKHFAEQPAEVDLAPVLERIAASEAKLAKLVDETCGSIEAKAETALAGLAKLAEQNVLILRALNDMRTDMNAKIGAVQESVDAAAEQQAGRPDPVCHAAKAESAQVIAIASAPAPKPPKHDPEPKSTKVPKRRVGIVGLLGAQSELISKEFGKEFELRFFSSEAANGREFKNAIGNCDVVMLMTAFANHGIESAVTAAGSKLVRVTGGLSSLRDKLTALFVDQAETAHG